MFEGKPDIKGRCEVCNNFIYKWEHYEDGYCLGVDCDVILANKIFNGVALFLLLLTSLAIYLKIRQL